MNDFKKGDVCWGIHTEWDTEEIVQVKLKNPVYDNDALVGFDAQDIGLNPYHGTIYMNAVNLFHSEADAEAAREKTVQECMDELDEETDTPEKMLNYLFEMIGDSEDGYTYDKVRIHLKKRARKMFGIEG